jgi:2-oxoglutarate dehydrogenase complex dehydrogenase (E1) component-like enzyme
MIKKLFKRKIVLFQKFLYNTTPKSTSYFHKESFASGNSVSYLENLEREWEKNPNSVDSKWASYFQSIKNISNITSSENNFQNLNINTESKHESDLKSSLISLINAYQSVGHSEATLCPCKNSI